MALKYIRFFNIEFFKVLVKDKFTYNTHHSRSYAGNTLSKTEAFACIELTF